MLFPKRIIWIAFSLLICVGAFAQKPKVHHGGKSMYTKGRYNVNATRVRGAKAKTMCPILSGSKYPIHGLGFKLGDPFAITYKYYASKSWGFVLDAGKASSGLYNRYYREKFEEIKPVDSDYQSHRVKGDFIGEAKVLYHFDATKVSPGLQFYIGAGWEWKSTNIRYSYSQPEDEDLLPPLLQLSHNRFTQGPQAVLGIEYSYFSIPISAFMEMEYFHDIQADPGWQKIEGGVGLRYIF